MALRRFNDERTVILGIAFKMYKLKGLKKEKSFDGKLEGK